MKIYDPTQLDLLLDRVHDRFYSLSGLSYDATDQCLSLRTTVVAKAPIRRRRKLLTTESDFEVFPAILRINQVLSYSLSDEAEVDEGDIKTIEYENSSVTIHGSLPVTLTIDVAELHIELLVESVPSALETRNAIALFGAEITTRRRTR